MKFTSFSVEIQDIAKEMAVAINGGEWPNDYQTESIQVGWALKAQWTVKKFGVDHETS